MVPPSIAKAATLIENNCRVDIVSTFLGDELDSSRRKSAGEKGQIQTTTPGSP